MLRINSCIRRSINIVIALLFLHCCVAALCNAVSVPPDTRDSEEWTLQLDTNDRNAFAGKPISLVAGVEIFKRTDLTLGSLFPIVIERNYNGKSGYDSPLGYGWGFTFDKRLYTYPDGSVIVRQGYGKKRKFEHLYANGTGPLVVILAPPGDCSPSCIIPAVVDNTISLAENAGTYTVTTKHGEKEQYDSFGRLTKMEDTNGNALLFYYELDSRSPLWGLLPSNVSQTSPLIVSYDYRLSRIEEQDASGSLTNRYVLFHYDGSTGRLNDIVDSTGRTVTYAHLDNMGNLTGVSGPSGNATYGYTDPAGSHRMTSADEGSGTYVNFYDEKGRVKSQTHGNGSIVFNYVTPYLQTSVITTIKDVSGNTLTNTRTVDFDSRGRVSKNTDTYGNVTNYQSNIYSETTVEDHWENTGSTLVRRSLTNYVYDDKANLIEKHEAIGTPSARSTIYTYDPVFNLVSTVTTSSVVDGAHDNVLTNTYDEKGNLKTTTETGLSGDGTYTYVTAYTYYPNGKLWTIDGPRSDVPDDITTFTYTSQGDILSVTRPLIGTTSYPDHDARGNPTTVTDPNGIVTSYEYDEIGRVTSIKATGDTAKTLIAYKTGGCQSCGGGANKIDYITLPEQNTIHYHYDDGMGNLTSITDDAGNSINYTYDSEGNKITEQIKEGDTLRKNLAYQYDALNRLLKTVNPESNTSIQYAYDFRGNSTSLITPNANLTTYTYDPLNRLKSVNQPGGITTLYGYNSNNNLTAVTDANGYPTTYRYDDKGRVYQVLSPDTGTTTYAYDPAGNMVSKKDAKNVTIGYQYDAANRLTYIDFPNDHDIQYTYDTPCQNGKGRLCMMVDASGTTTYKYSTKGQVIEESKTINGVSGNPYVTSYSYDQNGNIKTITYPSTRMITYNYDNNRVKEVKNGAFFIASGIGYYPFGPMKQITYGNNLGSAITYDLQYHISSLVTSTFQNLTYGHDNNGNITGITPNKTFTYDALDRLSIASGPSGSLSWTYDGVGNRIGSGYSYITGSNKLSGANGMSFGYDANGNTTGDSTRTYGYNDNQRLVSVSVAGTTYTYNGNGQRVKKFVNGVTTVFHYSLSGQLIAESNSAGNITAEYVYLNGQPLAMIAGGNTYYYHNDHLGTPQVMTDSTGVVKWSADYKPFGEATVDPSSTITNNLRFPGQYYDAETGLHQNGYRDYNLNGRYIESDPIGILPRGPRGGLNHLYLYAKNNPINNKDPKGLVALHGNWCGPNWTGGLPEQYTPEDELIYAFNGTKDSLDSCCKTHDKCFYKCRKNNPCDPQARKDCMIDCNLALSTCASQCSGMTSSIISSWMSIDDVPDVGPNDKSCKCKK